MPFFMSFIQDNGQHIQAPMWKIGMEDALEGKRKRRDKLTGGRGRWRQLVSGGFGLVWKQNISYVLEYWSLEDLWNLDHFSFLIVFPAKRLTAYLSTTWAYSERLEKDTGVGAMAPAGGGGFGFWGGTLAQPSVSTGRELHHGPQCCAAGFYCSWWWWLGEKQGQTALWGEGPQWRTAQAWGRTWPPELPSQLFSSLSLWLAHKVGFYCDNFHNQVIAVDVTDIRRCQVSILWTVWGFWNTTKKLKIEYIETS